MQLLGKAASGGLLNAAELSRSTGIPQTYAQSRYLTLLETLFSQWRSGFAAWSVQSRQRLQKSPKAVRERDYRLDAALAGLERAGMAAWMGYRGLGGGLFVHAELVSIELVRFAHAADALPVPPPE